MTRHRRIPAIVAIAATLVAGMGLFAVTGQFRAADLARASLPELERRVKDSKDARVWLAYADRLRDAARYDMAVTAYKKSLELRAELTEARLGQGLALGLRAVGKGASGADAFFDYVGRLSGMYPKVAVDLLARPELRILHGDGRWEPAVVGARAQAVD